MEKKSKEPMNNKKDLKMPEKMGSKSMKENSHLKHDRVKSIKQHRLVNDTAYFLHHPQIKPHGPNMPPKKPSE